MGTLAIKYRRNVPQTTVRCYRMTDGYWVGVITCLESCVYKSKSYKFRRSAYNDAKDKRKQLEKEIDESCRVVSEMDKRSEE